MAGVRSGSGRSGVAGAARGVGLLGCLVWLLLLGAALYVGVQFGLPHLQAWRFQDAMEGQAVAAEMNTDEEIRAFLSETAARLDIPIGAREIRIRRTRDAIAISAAWTEEIVLPKFRRTLHFQREAEAPLSPDSP